MTMPGTLKKTPLHSEHVALGAKMVPFAGYDMPVQYKTGILEEHRAVRTAAGLFDVSHMGEVEVRGPDALALVQRVTTNDASKLVVGQAQYSAICREDGGTLDDCIVYRMPGHYMIVVNASNRDKDRDWIVTHASGLSVQIADVSDAIALIALQGPLAQQILTKLTRTDLDKIAYYHFGEGQVEGVDGVISRTGYTGEDGFELYIDAGDAVRLWRGLLDAGESVGLIPAGLGARDSLRLEMGYALYGSDMDETRTPLEAGLGWVTKLDKSDFIGRDALLQQKQDGVAERLCGFVLKERGFPRHGYEVIVNGQPVSTVTSGVLSPSMQKGIGMAYLPAAATQPGTAIEIDNRGRITPAEVVKPPFYKEGSIRR